MACISGRSVTLVAKFVAVFIIAGVIASVIAVHFIQTAVRPSTSEPVSAPAPGSGPGQDIYAARLRKDEQSLDRGVLTYSPIESLKTAAKIQFGIVVTDVGRGPQHARLTEYNGMTVYQQDVPTGGIIGVQIVGCENLTCEQQSSPKQPVLMRGDSATWDWQITAGMRGPAKSHCG